MMALSSQMKCLINIDSLSSASQIHFMNNYDRNASKLRKKSPPFSKGRANAVELRDKYMIFV
jgi:hypothetical protein